MQCTSLPLSLWDVEQAIRLRSEGRSSERPWRHLSPYVKVKFLWDWQNLMMFAHICKRSRRYVFFLFGVKSEMRNTIGVLLFFLLLSSARLLWAEVDIFSLDGENRPMPYGVCDAQAAVGGGSVVAFIAPMQERADSIVNGFHASYLRSDGQLRELFAGFERALANPPLSRYRKTTNIQLAANRDFSRFAIIVEFIKTGTTVDDVVQPKTLGTELVVVDGDGNKLAEAELSSDEGSVSARQCHVSFSDDGKLLAACGQYIGLRLYDSPLTDLMSFQTFDVGYTTGTAVITGDGAKVFFTKDNGSQRTICYVETATGHVVETGLTGSALISDAQVAVNHDGSCVVFRQEADSLVIASWENGAWQETVIEGKQIRNPAVSADGRFVVYQVRGKTCFQIMAYDRQYGMTMRLSENKDGVEADADCTLPSISADGAQAAFISAASNLSDKANGKLQVYVTGLRKVSMTLELKQGWNLCGLPFTPDSDSIALLNGIGVYWGWMSGRFKPLGAIQAGQGFWLYSTEDTTLELTGERMAPAPLRRGWNLLVPLLYSEIEMAKCFGLEGETYIQLPADADRAQTVWVFR